MSRRIRHPLMHAGSAVLVGALAACGAAGGAGAAANKTPAKDSFTGRISSATGSYNGSNGAARIYLHVPSSSERTRPVTVTIRPRPCGHAKRCLQLDGSLHGTLTQAGRHVADIGQAFSLNAPGTVSPLGKVTTTGTVRGTGFIHRAREPIEITLRGLHGTITLSGYSGSVPGFTSP